MKIASTTRLKIRDQKAILDQIAGTYKDFFRAAMEYIDNSIDAAAIRRKTGENFKPIISVDVDYVGKKVSFTDNCGGMNPQELCGLLCEVGLSKKKTVAWVNGRFGFGVHAFRAFAKEASFVSRKKGAKTAHKIKIDRETDENTDVHCLVDDGKSLNGSGTQVILSRFNPHVFKKSTFFTSLAQEIEHHFDDVLRSGDVKIHVRENGGKEYKCSYFDFDELPGASLKQELVAEINGTKTKIIVDLKYLEHSQTNRLPVLTSKQRRIQTISDLKSYKNFVRSQGATSYVWQNPFIVGSIEVGDICSPNLTRDDLKDEVGREVLYQNLLVIQKELKVLEKQMMDKKTQESFKKLGNIMSDCLSKILRDFNLKFEQMGPTNRAGVSSKSLDNAEGNVPFGSEGDEGGGSGPDRRGVGGKQATNGSSGVGDEGSGGSRGKSSKKPKPGSSETEVMKASGPEIKFGNHGETERIIDLGGSLIVNVQHPDFKKRNITNSGKIMLDARLINYVSVVIAPPCVHRLFEKGGKVPSALEVGNNVINLSMQLESELSGTVKGQEINVQ